MRLTCLLHATMAAGALLGLVGVACGTSSYHPDNCADPATCQDNACPGRCVPLPPQGFSGPVLLWVGSEAQAPECPTQAPQQVYVGHSGLHASHECASCECTEPACVLPAGIVASTLSACPSDGPGVILTDFDAPPSWDGSCTSPTIVSPDMLGSMTFQPATERPCEAVPQTSPQDSAPIIWDSFARACSGENIDASCQDQRLTCLSSADPPPPGFRQCIMSMVPDDETDVQCPEDYPDMHVFFGAVDDTRACTECSCTSTATSTCVVYMSVFQDSRCTSSLVQNFLVGMTEPLCVDLAPGLQLGGMAAEWLTNQPGTCEASGGMPTGEAKPKDPRTFCCQPPPGQ
jgi:hypothetical protein